MSIRDPRQGGSGSDRVRVGECEVSVSADLLERLLASEKFDAVVSSDDTDLSMGGGVSAAIRELAGAEFVREARSLTPAKIGAIVVTGSGRLPVRFVLHAVTVDWRNGIMPTPRSIAQLGRELFVRCEALGIESLLMPAIATGAARFPPEPVAETLLGQLELHCANRSILKRVVFSLPDPTTRNAFLTRLTNGPQPAARLGGAIVPVDFTTAAGLPATGAPPQWPQPLRPLFERVTGAAQEAPPTGPVRRSLGGSGWWWPFGKSPTAPPKRRPASSSDDTVPVMRSIVGASAGTMAYLSPETLASAFRPVLARRYVVLEEVGRGGFSVVHMAWDLVLRRIVAIKRMRADSADQDTLRKEAAVAIDLAHECIVRLHHFEPGEAPEQAFLVMEYVPWPTGEKWVALAGEVGLPPPAVLEIGLQVCDALGYAHERGILHLDLKPGNLFVDPAADHVKLADFGLARSLERASRALMTHPAGTPAYMAPEQSRPGSRVSRATDVFLLAATVWDMLTGAPPSAHQSDPRRAARSPLMARVLAPLVPALDATPAKRPQNARDLRGLFEEALAAC